jgi:arsenate reductase-like glutaredoxin family protein
MFYARIYGTAGSIPTRDARRFFRESEIETRYTNLSVTPIPAMELRRFVAAFTLAGIVDTDSPAYASILAGRASIPDGELFTRVLSNPSLLRLPLVRGRRRYSVGDDEDAWDKIAKGLSL